MLRKILGDVFTRVRLLRPLLAYQAHLAARVNCLLFQLRNLSFHRDLILLFGVPLACRLLFKRLISKRSVSEIRNQFFVSDTSVSIRCTSCFLTSCRRSCFLFIYLLRYLQVGQPESARTRTPCCRAGHKGQPTSFSGVQSQTNETPTRSQSRTAFPITKERDFASLLIRWPKMVQAGQ